MTTKNKTNIGSALKVFVVLDVLLRNFAHGFSPKELKEATGYSGTDIFRYVNTLVDAGFAERITETGRIRPSERFARHAVQILHSLNTAEKQLTELNQRINRT